ncbi:hypothetical protein Tco_0222562 [Tanacetum coccineum]
MMMASKSYKRHPTHKEFYDALIQSLFVDEDDIDKAAAAADQSTQVKRNHDDQDEDPTARSDQGKEKKRPRKDTQPSKKYSASKESSKYVEENIVDEMGNAKEQHDGEAAPKTDNAPKNNWFKQPLRPPTPDPEWNKCQVVNDQPEQTWFNDLVKPLPLKGRPGHLTIPAGHLFNNNLEYLKLENMERKYITLIKDKGCEVNKQFGYWYLEEIVLRRVDVRSS